MECQHAVSFIGMSTNAAEMHHTFYARLLNSLLVIIRYFIDRSHIIEVLVEETVSSHRFHKINYVGTGKSFCEEIYVFHSADGRFCTQRFNVFLPLNLTADNGN